MDRMAVPLRLTAADVSGRRSRCREFPAPAGLAAVVRCTWEGVPGWPRVLRVLPDGCVDLVWDGDRLLVVNARSGAVRFPLSASGRPVGVRLRCGAAGGLLGPAFADAEVREIFPPGQRVHDEMRAAPTPAAQRGALARFVAARWRAGFAPDPAIPAVVRALAAPDARMDVVAERIGVSVRTLRRRVRTAAGCGPKELQRVLRFQKFLRRLDDVAAAHTTLSSVAADLGFADQAHLGHDCLKLSGSTPARLVASYAWHARVAENNQTPPR